MPNPTINGRIDPVFQGTEIEYDPERGLFVVNKWESAGDNLSGIAAALQGNRTPYTLQRSAHRSFLASRTPGGSNDPNAKENQADTWEVQVNELQKSIYESPLALYLESSWPGTLGYLRRDLDLYNQGQDPGSPAPDAAAVTAGAGKLFDLLIRGTTHYALSQYVLKHTTHVATTYSANVADVGVGCIYTSAQLIAECQNAALWAYPMPGRLAYKIGQIASPAARTDYLWGWLKKAATETAAAGSRIEISTEYWLEQWSTLLYAVKA